MLLTALCKKVIFYFPSEKFTNATLHSSECYKQWRVLDWLVIFTCLRVSWDKHSQGFNSFLATSFNTYIVFQSFGHWYMFLFSKFDLAPGMWNLTFLLLQTLSFNENCPVIVLGASLFATLYIKHADTSVFCFSKFRILFRFEQWFCRVPVFFFERHHSYCFF